MDVVNMVTKQEPVENIVEGVEMQSHSYPTRQGSMSQEQSGKNMRLQSSATTTRSSKGPNGTSTGLGFGRASPAKKDQKHVLFQLIDPEDPRIQARLPMRVMISQHDNTDSIITTVKNFYGLYEHGVSFENKEGISIIAAYDNFEHDMVVYVRTVSPPPTPAIDGGRASSPKKPSLGAAFEMRAPLHLTTSPSRTAARSAGVRSLSPQSELGQRSASVAPGNKPRFNRTKSKDASVVGDADGYSSGDNGGGSVTSSRRSNRTEQVNAEISVDNIVEGGRRKRAFESSELPLFVPPQVPITTSVSSMSPQRRAGPAHAASPYSYSNQQTFSYSHPLPSPQSFGGAQSGSANGGFNGTYQPPNRRSGRPSVTYPPVRLSHGGVLPTPDPTVGSAISDEDVALQLMRLGDPAGFSHGRTSTSTVDDALSGKADAASSDSDDVDDDSAQNLSIDSRIAKHGSGPQRKKQRLNKDLPSDGTSSDDSEDNQDDTFAGHKLSMAIEGQRRLSKHKSHKQGNRPRAESLIKPKTAKAMPPIPISPSSLPAQSRKPSITSTGTFQNTSLHGEEDDEDMSSKPRCQRCRKSKKGCDRQRPCGRCQDAGIGIEGCVSEDEGNGRKGRYGRHMGVSVKKPEDGEQVDEPMHNHPPQGGYFLAPALPDKNKKRKR